MKLAFFVDGERYARKIIALSQSLENNVFYEVLIVILCATVLLVVIGILRARRIAFKMTAQIIHLYETLYQIAEAKKEGAVELSFRETSKELNELHLTFNRVARTINLATESLQAQVTDE